MKYKTPKRIMAILKQSMMKPVRTKAEGKVAKTNAKLFHKAFTHFDGNLSEL